MKLRLGGLWGHAVSPVLDGSSIRTSLSDPPARLLIPLGVAAAALDLPRSVHSGARRTETTYPECVGWPHPESDRDRSSKETVGAGIDLGDRRLPALSPPLNKCRSRALDLMGGITRI